MLHIAYTTDGTLVFMLLCKVFDTCDRKFSMLTNSMHARKSTIGAITFTELKMAIFWFTSTMYPSKCVANSSEPKRTLMVYRHWLRTHRPQPIVPIHTHRERQWPRLFSNIKNNRIKPHPNSEYVN